MKKLNTTWSLLTVSMISLFSLSACNSGAGGGGSGTNSMKAETIQSKNVKNLNAIGIQLGDPSINMAPSVAVTPDVRIIPQQNSCIDFSESDPVTYGNEVSQFNYKQNMTSEQILKTLGIDGSLKGSYKDFSGDFAASYLDSAAQTTNEITLTMYSSTSALVGYKGVHELNKEQPQPVELSACGDSYVSRARGGIYVETTIHIKFENSNVKNTVTANGNISYGSLEELIGSVDKLDSSIKNKITVEVELIQRGGDSKKIFDILNSYKQNSREKDDGFYLASMGLDASKALVTRIQEYIGGSSGDAPSSSELQQQVNQYMHQDQKIKINTVSDLKGIFITNVDTSITHYPQSKTNYEPNAKLQTLVDQHSASYTTLMAKLKAYNNYRTFITDFEGTFEKQPPAITNSRDSFIKMQDISQAMINTSKKCYGYVASEKDITDCILDLSAEKEEEFALEKSIDATNWNKGYKIRSSSAGSATQPDSEYLIDLGNSDNVEYFVTYSSLPTKALYAPGSIYSFTTSSDNTATGAFENLTYVTPSTNAENSIRFSTTNSKVTGSLIQFGAIDYSKFEDDTSYLPTPAQKINATGLFTKIAY